ncbi:MAG TPA: site-2 protease family protein [Thermoleophilaceae bacterium]
MFGGRSLQLARVFGIRIGVNPSWFFILFLLIWSLSASYKDVTGSDSTAFALAVASALLFFGSILLHELGHAFVAVRNGIEIEGIELWLFGGMARMRREAPTAGAEFKVAVAGPIVTLLVVVACTALGIAIGGADEFKDAVRFSGSADISPGVLLLGWLAEVNAFLFVLNILPGFPLDGGRMVRAIAWWRTGDRLRATRIAARLGVALAYLLGALGVFLFLQGYLIEGVWDIFIAFFIYQAARVEEAQTGLSTRLKSVSVADVMDDEPVSIPASLPLDRAYDDYFLRYGWQWFPVVDENGRYVGVLDRDRVDQVPHDTRQGWQVREAVIGSRDDDLQVPVDESLDALLGSEGLQRLGALMAVDRDGVLRGVVTLDRVRAALRASIPAA